MNSRRLQLIVGSIVLIVILAACAFSTASTPAGNSATPASALGNASASTNSGATPTAAAPNQPAGAATSGGCANTYYPVISGATRTYSSSGNVLGDYTYSVKIFAVSDTGFSTSYLFSNGVNSTIQWNCQNGNLAALDAGAESFSMSTSKIKMDSTSINETGYNIPASFDTGQTWSENVTVNATVTVSATRSVNSQISNQVTCSAGGTDTITVPAGTFDTVKAVCSKTMVVSAIMQGKTVPINTNHENITSWYAKGVGFVKSVATGGSNNETVVLIQYKN